MPNVHTHGGPAPIIVPVEKINEETLKSLAKEILVRELGSDDPTSTAIFNSAAEHLDLSPVTKLIHSLRNHHHFLTFDPKTESVGIISAEELSRRRILS